MENDKELKAIVEIEILLDGMKFEAKHRVLDFVRARVSFDPVIDGGAGLLAATPRVVQN